MRSSSREQTRNREKQTKSMVNLLELKRTTQNFPLLKNNLFEQKSYRRTQGDTKYQGKLQLGHTIKPALILSKQQRNNPWAKRTVIAEDLLQKKGIMQLMCMGVFTKNIDCGELLNNKYEVIIEKKESPKDVFMTNPAILISTYYEANKKQEEEFQKGQKLVVKQKQKEKKIRVGSKKKKQIKKQQLKPQFEVIEEKIRLTILNFCFEQNQIYRQYVKKLNSIGMGTHFRCFASKVQDFSKRFNLKKITIIPELNETGKITDHGILRCIVNHKIYGIDLKMKGSPQSIMQSFVKMWIAKRRYHKMRQSLKKIEKIKNNFRNKKFFFEMIDKRWQYIKFRLGSFAENQRRFIEQNFNQRFKPDVEIHIICLNQRGEDLKTYYKLEERKRMQLTRLFNNEASDIILLVNHSEPLSWWLNQIEDMKSNWRKPKIHLIQSKLEGYSTQQYASIYFGLTPQIISRIRLICQGKTAMIIPYKNSIYLSKICQTVNAHLFGGNFDKESLKELFEQQNSVSKMVENNQKAKFKKIKSTENMTNRYLQNLRKITLANFKYQSKPNSKGLFIRESLKTPIHLSIAAKNQKDFYLQLAQAIVSNKDSDKWVLKLPNSTFSRGLAYLETDSLKIIKEAKRKAKVVDKDILQIAQILEDILIQKIMMPHSQLYTGQQFISEFKRQEGYIEVVVEDTVTIGVFGRIQMDGHFTLLGTYKKYYVNYICFGAIYPFHEITQKLLVKIKAVCTNLKNENYFGYITFELLFQQNSKEFYFIDIVPYMNQYSSLFFYYKRLLDLSDADEGQKGYLIKKSIFYCPFIDNNGTKCTSVAQFQLQCKQKHIVVNEALEGQKFLFLTEGSPQALSLICIASHDNIAVRMCLDAFNFLVDTGGEFNKFDKRCKNIKTDGLYLLDIIWRLRQIKKSNDKI